MGKKKTDDPPLRDVLKSAIAEAQNNGWSINAIARESGLPQATLAEWYAGKSERLGLPNVERLIAHFGISIGPATRNLHPHP